MKKRIALAFVIVFIGTITTAVMATNMQPVPKEIKVEVPPVLSLPDGSQLFSYPPIFTLPNGKLSFSWLRVIKWPHIITKPFISPIGKPVTPPICEPIQPIVIRPLTIIGGSVQQLIISYSIYQLPIINGPIKKPIVGEPIEMPIVVPLEES